MGPYPDKAEKGRTGATPKGGDEGKHLWKHSPKHPPSLRAALAAKRGGRSRPSPHLWFGTVWPEYRRKYRKDNNIGKGVGNPPPTIMGPPPSDCVSRFRTPHPTPARTPDE